MLKISVITPAGSHHPGLAIASARAGAQVFLDVEFNEVDGRFSENLAATIAKSPADAVPGLRLRPSDAGRFSDALGLLADRKHALLVTGWDARTAAEMVAALPACGEREWYFEILDAPQVSDLAGLPVPVAGLIAKGQECGGRVGEKSSFILLQELAALTPLPVHVQGGIGPSSAAACQAGGAVGVVLDDQLWLMPESPLPAAWQQVLRMLNGSETVLRGELTRAPVRVLWRPGFLAAEALRDLEEAADKAEDPQIWMSGAAGYLGWGNPAEWAWPVGQSVGLASIFTRRYRTTGRLIEAIRREAADAVARAAELKPLAPGSPLAESHGTRFPIVQGPMTRVSDVAPFASAVAKAGALPMLALALLRAPQVEKLLLECRELLAGLPWGVGILGFVPTGLRNEQLEVVQRIRPPFAIIAGGQPEQAAHLERDGIPTYLHVPSPQLLEMFIGRGSRRFIFEGRECGGHVGPLSSFCLWEEMIDKLQNVTNAEAREMHLLFAGGIHDGVSAAMISALAAPLAARGMKIGVLMGTAYLFAREAVECGAILPRFQQEALNCRRTINLETGPGHASRCVVTPFAGEFYQTRRELIRQGEDRKKISEILDGLTLGRLRVASKGLTRENGEIVPVEEPEQYRQGMYMIGQVATLRHHLMSLEELHSEVSDGSVARVASISEPVGESVEPEPSDIAIVGLSVLLPGAQDAGAYWRNILGKKNSIGEVPAHRWDWRLYFDENKAEADKIYSKWGGFLDEFPFDPSEYGIPPSAAKVIEPMQMLALEAVKRALADAGCENGNFDREHTAVVFGASGGMGDLGQLYATRSSLPQVIGPGTDGARDRLPEWTGDSFPGILLNVVAGRVANRFDLGGANYVVDAACASSLASIESAVRELESGQCNMAIAGGVDTMQSPFGYFCFSRSQALSARGEVRPFDKQADGIVISEGVGVVVLKRLADAERDGDRVYAVIKAFGSSSDGRGSTMTVPASGGQTRALRRAYGKAGFSPATIGLYEAHGTGTPLGDRVELESLSQVLRDDGAPPKSCAVGSVKSIIGHTKGAAGVAGLIKAALSLHYKVLPPHAGVEDPVDVLADESGPIFVLKEPAAWVAHPAYPRRAGVSAFGFGGTNFHAVLEEYASEVVPQAPGAGEWPCELFAWRAQNLETLITELAAFQVLIRAGRDSLSGLAHGLATGNPGQGPVTLSLTATSRGELDQSVEKALADLRAGGTPAAAPNRYHGSTDSTRAGEVAFLFPGQGSQYPEAAAEASLYLPEISEALADAETVLSGRLEKRLSQFLYPPAAFTAGEKKAAAGRLSATQVAQPVIGALSCGYFDVLSRIGLEPDFVAGHSYGEYTALHAAGVLSRDEFFGLSALRGEAMQNACSTTGGGMAAVLAPRDDVARRIAGTRVVLANHNSPSQTVISGPREAVDDVIAALAKDGIAAKLLPVAGAFHSPLMEEAQKPLLEGIAAAAFHAPGCSVFSNTTARAHSKDPETIRQLLGSHMLSAVEFVAEIEAMYEAGARIFVEVGPRNILTALVSEVLADRPDVVVVALDSQRGSLRGFLDALARLHAAGLNLNLKSLFAGRARALVPASASEKQKPWLLSGCGIRKPSDEQGLIGKSPLLRSDTLPAATHLPRTSEVTIVPSQSLEVTKPQKRTYEMNRPYETALHAYSDYQETMRSFLKVQEEVMKQFLAGSSGNPVLTADARDVTPAPVTPASMTSAPAPAPVAAAVAAAPVVAPLPPATVAAVSPEPVAAASGAPQGREDLTKILLDLVSERTGYPQEMLGMDQDLEADLGIDSIKRVEIVGAFQTHLPPAMVEKLTGGSQDLSRMRTLNGWVDALLAPAA